MKKYIAFLCWIPTKFWEWIQSIYSEYIDIIEDTPGLGFVMMLFGSVILTGITGILFRKGFGASNEVTSAVMCISLLTPIVNFFVVQTRKLYRAFCKERQDTFNALK